MCYSLSQSDMFAGLKVAFINICTEISTAKDCQEIYLYTSNWYILSCLHYRKGYNKSNSSTSIINNIPLQNIMFLFSFRFYLKTNSTCKKKHL